MKIHTVAFKRDLVSQGHVTLSVTFPNSGTLLSATGFVCSGRSNHTVIEAMNPGIDRIIRVVLQSRFSRVVPVKRKGAITDPMDPPV